MKKKSFLPNNTHSDNFFLKKYNFASEGKIKSKKKISKIPILKNFSTNTSSIKYYSQNASPKYLLKSNLHLKIDSILNDFKSHPLITKQLIQEETKQKLNSLSNKDFNIIFDDKIKENLKSNNKNEMSRTLINIFNKKTKNILDIKKSIPKFSRNIISFRNQIIQNFTDKFSPNQLKKSKNYYDEVLKYLEKKEDERVLKAQKYDKEFYQIRLLKKTSNEIPLVKKRTRTKSFYRNINTSYKSYKNAVSIQKYTSQQFEDPFYKNSQNNYEDIQYVHSQGNSHSRLNLERVIRMQNLKNVGFNSDDELFENNPKGLKKLIADSEEEVYKRIQGYIPNFIHDKIKKTTISKYKQLNGMFFGMPV